MHRHEQHQYPPRGFIGWFLSWRGIILTIAFAAISYYLLTTHREHMVLALPYLVLLACPLMHIFGHGHGRHGTHGKNGEK